jgi:hypothetical protein
MLRVMPTTAANVKGSETGCPSSVNVNPLTEASSVIFEVRGKTSRKVVF